MRNANKVDVEIVGDRDNNINNNDYNDDDIKESSGIISDDDIKEEQKEEELKHIEEEGEEKRRLLSKKGDIEKISVKEKAAGIKGQELNNVLVFCHKGQSR
jgi:DNA replicative helicase MCM subunit Mcm2 (Cdc46/Mcm family)